MSDLQFDELNGASAVYSVSGLRPMNKPSAPQKAKSTFADEYDVPYSECRTQMVEYLGTKYILVGHIND